MGHLEKARTNLPAKPVKTKAKPAAESAPPAAAAVAAALSSDPEPAAAKAPKEKEKVVKGLKKKQVLISVFEFFIYCGHVYQVFEKES